MAHKLPELGYAYDALEPYIDAQTMEIHHSKHHQAYVNNLNGILEKHPDWAEKETCELMARLNEIPEDIRGGVRNNGGGVFNHTFFFGHLKTNVEFSGDVAEAITGKFGSLESFQEQFAKAGATRFGSGWAWLVVSKGELEVISTANQDNPITDGKYPLLAMDVWEHAYYLKYQNRRPDYMKAFFNVIDWDKVNAHYKAAMERETA